ncbi:type II toxin-antitoxin system prevent-host-death family antitoxin [Streptomyces johnsoniae]|uniref:Type II toxin-antitoxin system prevent-host-death family antitoxin n=1 Tax=Streptomyces johnsoniae TaxID=3075532 RepID=A0ABU2SCX2_9ACTN|nr:type II toxin-antitoxin system prevent-host-death family antitoxin [Streptomyces sp. DSM 41886]MDT0446800.1 type II toxin-antitoxin system prevent-host-death family antitoxin [Streptomyces sp. DSM 41886]
MSEYAPLRGLTRLGPWDAIPVSAAGEQLAVLARRVADSREEIALTDEEGTIVAVVISPSKLEDLEDDLAVARNEIDRRDGKEPIPHEELVARLRRGE